MTKSNTLKKQQRLFQEMMPEELAFYCKQHPSDSLAIGIRNQRAKESLDILANCAKELPSHSRRVLGAYLYETFKRGNVTSTPVVLNAIYSPLLTRKNFEKEPLTNAINEFLGFAKTPMTPERLLGLIHFRDHMTARPQKATPFQKGMDLYIHRTAYFPHQTL